MTGLVTVADTRDVSISILTRSFTLCDYLAYGLVTTLNSSLNCDNDVSDWTYPPDATTADGDEAWRTSSNYAATAVYVE